MPFLRSSLPAYLPKILALKFELRSQDCQPDVGNPDLRWRIGEGGIRPSDVMVIGAVHVSSASGSWMPILQLNRYLF